MSENYFKNLKIEIKKMKKKHQKNDQKNFQNIESFNWNQFYDFFNSNY